MPVKDITQLKQLLAAMTKIEREVFAKKCGTTVGNLNQIIYSTTNCGAELAIAIDRESNGKVNCDSLCPKADFDYLRNQDSDLKEQSCST